MFQSWKCSLELGDREQGGQGELVEGVAGQAVDGNRVKNLGKCNISGVQRENIEE